MPSRTRAALTFISPQDGKPLYESAAFTGGEPRALFETEQHVVDIHDMRAIADVLCLDRHGFELHDAPTGVDDLYDDDSVATRYGAELRDILRSLTGADRVVVFDYTRRSDHPCGAANPDGYRAPAPRAHVDYTVDSGPGRARDVLGGESFDATVAAGGRIVQVNVWRPIRGPICRSPLALADASSVKRGDLVATDQIFPDRVGEIYHLAHAPGQRWYWAPDMARDEVLLIKGWDSMDDGRAMFTPHTAFVHPEQSIDAAPRESIEARAYLVFDAQPPYFTDSRSEGEERSGAAR